MSRIQNAILVSLLVCILCLIVFAVSTPEKSERQANGQAAEKYATEQFHHIQEKTFWQRTADDPVAVYTAALVLFTAVLALVSIIQIRFLICADEMSKRASNAAQVAAEAAKASVELANKEFIASHRAKIIVRNMHFPIMPVPHIDENDIGFDVIVAFYCMNVGETEAIIDNVEAAITLKHPKRPIARNQNMISCTPDRTVLPFCQFGAAKVAEVIPPGYVREIHEGRLLICCTGCVQYKDGRGALRQTGFVRLYNMETDRFDIVDDAEYEYSY